MTPTSDDLIRAIGRAEDYAAACNGQDGVPHAAVFLGLRNCSIVVVAVDRRSSESPAAWRHVRLSDIASAAADVATRCPLLTAIDDALDEVRSRYARSH